MGIEERDGAFAVTLDKRPLRTPGGKHLLVPKDKRLVATLIASEWENQETLLKQHSLPMVRAILSPHIIANSFLDIYCFNSN